MYMLLALAVDRESYNYFMYKYKLYYDASYLYVLNFIITDIILFSHVQLSLISVHPVSIMEETKPNQQSHVNLVKTVHVITL